MEILAEDQTNYETVLIADRPGPVCYAAGKALYQAISSL
jgi:hypothetical protein